MNNSWQLWVIQKNLLCFLRKLGENNFFIIWSIKDFGIISSKTAEVPISQSRISSRYEI